MWKRVEALATIALALAAIAIAVVAVRRDVLGGGPSAPRIPQLTLDEAPSWNRIVALATPVTIGDERVHLVEFTDLECPACRHFHLSTLAAAFEGAAIQPTFSIVHFPLRGHRFAEAAATAAECASTQGRGAELVNTVFQRQDSLGLASWTSFAVAAGVPDTTAFQACVSAGPGVRVRDGAALAAELGLRETPMIFLNGKRLSRPPSAEELRELVQSQAAARPRTR